MLPHHMRLTVFYRFIGLLFAVSATRPELSAQEPIAAPAPPVLTNAAQLRTISSTEAASKIPVKIRAVVTAISPGRTIFLQDDTGGTFITQVKASFASTRPGDLIEVEGVTYPGLFVPGITQSKVRKVGRSKLPVATPITYDNLLSSRWHYER